MHKSFSQTLKSPPALISSSTLETICKGALGGMSFGAYHQFNTNKIMELNNKVIDEKHKYEIDKLRNEHKNEMNDLKNQLKIIQQQQQQTKSWWL